jgi:hypothetical protein
MILYHGSNIIIQNIDLNKCRPYKDFGKGFYCTTIRSQAELMAKRVAAIYGGTPTVMELSMSDDIFKDEDLIIKEFEMPSKEWALFVLNNRNRSFDEFHSKDNNYDCKYDMVVGPVADDALALLFRSFSNGLIDIDILVKDMKFKKFTNQYSFHSVKAIGYLKFIGGSKNGN